MIYPENIFIKLGLQDVKELIADKCITISAKEMVDKIQPLYKYDVIQRYLRQVNEFKELLVHDQNLSMDPVYPLDILAEKSRVEGSFLLEEDFHHIQLTLKTVFSILLYFKNRSEVYPYLESLIGEISIEKGLIQEIQKVIDEKGKMRPQASPLLMDIVMQIQKSEVEVRKRIDQIFKHAQSQGWTADGNLTVRDGRMCIPILAENKRKIKGFIHDESATGQTAYIEPEEVFQLNNKIRDLEFEKRREIIRILTSLTDFIRPYQGLLVKYHQLITRLDFVRAKALFALDVGGELPELTTHAEINLVQAEHPLLKLALKKEGKSVVPLNLKIDETDRILVVSGPNAGGKSVCMKTVGLLQLMCQSGILIPADPTSKMGIFKDFFADIGDDQSIESDLSTYSAHLHKMKVFTENCSAKSLVLIDEFGTGTDPQFGGPMAESVLEVLNKKKVRGVITTHYSNLKTFAGNTEGLENASMLFDHIAMQPQYILQIGKPGSSYAFEIAEKIGLAPQILKIARHKVGRGQKKVDSLLVDLEKDKNQLLERERILAKKEKQIEQLKIQNEELQNYLEANKKEILKKAKEEAKQILGSANKLIENTISDIKKSAADKELTKKLRLQLEEEQNKLKSQPQAQKTSKNSPSAASSSQVLEAGDWVRILDSGKEAQILEIAKNNVVLAFGELRTIKKRSEVEKLNKSEVKKQAKKGAFIKLQEDLNTFSPDIDVRGMRTEEALYEIEKQLDKAIILGHSYLRIVHGKGDGILRKFIRDYFRKFDQITRFEDEHVDRGGDGITYAYLK